MAGRAKKTEHAGPKKGSGAYWGRKADAKRESNRVRRENAKRAVRQSRADSEAEIEDWTLQVRCKMVPSVWYPPIKREGSMQFLA